MRLDIPQELPHRRAVEGGPPGTTAPKLPDDPILHRLKSLEERAADHRWIPPGRGRKPRQPLREVQDERRHPVAATGARRPSRTVTGGVGLDLRPEERQLLREAARFRVVRTVDLCEALYNGKSRLLEDDLVYLRKHGLVETQYVNLRAGHRQRRTIERIEVVSLTKAGLRRLISQGEMPKDQRSYSGLVRRRQIEHDSQIYRAYRKEAAKITEKGGTNLRVMLDFEIRSQVWKTINAERDADAQSDLSRVRQQVAERFALPFVDGIIQIPDARIEYDLPRNTDQEIDQGSSTGHVDIEVLTAAYRAAYLRLKVQAGFRNYAASSDRATLTARIEDDHHLIEYILEL
jgi:hypothetical protein